MEHVSARKEHRGRTGGGKRKREMGGLRAVSKVDKERHENWRVRRKGRECWTRWRRASDCACTGHTRKVDPHNDLVTNCLDRKYYRREPWATRERKNAGPITRRALSPRFLAELMREEKWISREIAFSHHMKKRRTLSVILHEIFDSCNYKL